METVEFLAGVRLGGLLAQIGDLVPASEATDCVAEHPLRMTQPPTRQSARTAIRIE